MASSYVQLTREIEALKKKAEQARKQEAAALIEVIKSGIATYGLTAQDLGLAGASGARSKAQGKVTVGAKSTAAGTSTPKYQDGAGNSWSGRGPKPGWVKTALASGLDLTDLLAGAPAKPAAAPKAPSSKSLKVKAAKPASGKAKATAIKKPKASARKVSKPVQAVAAPASSKASAVKYKDAAGNTWSGRGPKPGWLRDALATGKTLEDMLA
ncbi:MAG: H-NS histone family protein [Burkholderiales bacterium]|nr:H-NS histone family protein [Burkholderiales bacterium]